MIPRRLFLLPFLFAAAPLLAVETTVTRDILVAEDGDTLVIQLDGKEERIQLAGIDAPEDSEGPKLERDLARTGLDRETLLALGQAATEHLRGLIAAGGPFNITYDPEKRDRYGRLTAEVSGAAAGSLNIAMLEDGFAMVLAPPGTAEDSAALGRLPLEQEAVKGRRGLWGEQRDAALAWRGRKSE